MPGPDVDDRLRRIWMLTGVVFLLHGVIDPLVTYLAVGVYGTGVEGNPLLRGSVRGGGVEFAMAHGPLFVVGVLCLVALTLLFQRASGDDRGRIYRLSMVLLGTIIAWGLLLVGWNLWMLSQGLPAPYG